MVHAMTTVLLWEHVRSLTDRQRYTSWFWWADSSNCCGVRLAASCGVPKLFTAMSRAKFWGRGSSVSSSAVVILDQACSLGFCIQVYYLEYRALSAFLGVRSIASTINCGYYDILLPQQSAGYLERVDDCCVVATRTKVGCMCLFDGAVGSSN